MTDNKIHKTHFMQPEMPYKVSDRFRNLHAGETGLVVTNGPSLADVSDNLLAKYPTIGMNHIYERFIPNYYCLLGLNQMRTSDQRRLYRPVIGGVDCAFINRTVLEDARYRQVSGAVVSDWNENIIGVLSSDRQGRRQGRRFSYEIEKKIGIGYTNTYPCIQIMFWLGFETVLIVGLDNDYTADPDKRHFYPDAEHNSCETLHGNDKFMSGSDYVFSLAAAAYKEHGRRLINLTPTDKTPSLEMGDIGEWE